MKKFIIILLICAGTFFVLGWVRAGGDNSVGISEEDVWSNAPLSRGDTQVLTQMGKQIRSTELFKLSKKDELALAETNKNQQVLSDSNAPSFPIIGSIAKVDNKYSATFIMEDGTLLSRTPDESLPNGWVIKKVDLRQVIAVFKDEESRFPVAKYLDSAFEIPEEKQDSVSGGKN